MMAPAPYGVLVGVVFIVFTRLAPQPTGSVVLWTLFAVQLTLGAVVCWRRTGLPFATTALAIGGALSAALAFLAANGRIFPDLPRQLWVPVGIGFVSGPVFLLVESRINRAKWKQWADYMERKNGWDILTGRHIPQLRDDGA